MNLIPEQRVDKNGILVTRHVRPQSSSALTGFPVPVVNAPDPMRGRWIKDLDDKCRGWHPDQKQDNPEFTTRLGTFSDETLKLITDSVGDDDTQVFMAELTQLLEDGKSESEVREYMVFSTDLLNCEDMDDTYHHINGAHNYPAFNDVSDLTLLDDKSQQSVHTLLAFANHIDYVLNANRMAVDEDVHIRTMPDNTHIIEPVELVDLIVDNPDRGDDLLAFIRAGESNYRDIDAMREVVNNTHTAISDGFL